jgi:hypothetical protein
VKVPEKVDRGADFTFMLRTFRTQAEGSPVEEEGVPFEYAIAWPGGSTAPLRHRGESAEAEKVRARMLPGEAVIFIYAPDKEGQAIKVAEARFRVQ